MNLAAVKVKFIHFQSFTTLYKIKTEVSVKTFYLLPKSKHILSHEKILHSVRRHFWN